MGKVKSCNSNLRSLIVPFTGIVSILAKNSNIIDGGGGNGYVKNKMARAGSPPVIAPQHTMYLFSLVLQIYQGSKSHYIMNLPRPKKYQSGHATLK